MSKKIAVINDLSGFGRCSLTAAIPTISADGIYGPQTAEAVEVFQSVFGLPVTGVVDYATWYKISEIYVGVTRIAELY